MSGGSRGIGLAIALKAAADGANVVVAAKTDTPHPKLPGTIHTAVEEIEAAGGKGLAVVCDIRDEDQVQAAVDQAVARFGGIDICINNASAIQLTGTLDTPMKRYDLMNGVNARGTFLVSKTCIPHLKTAANPHILNLSPPLDMDPKWFRNNVAYTMARMSRSPQIVADAAHAILTRPSRECTGKFFIDEVLLRETGVTDFSVYGPEGGGDPVADFFVPDAVIESLPTKLQRLLG